MIGNLDTAIRNLLKAALPTLVGGLTPPVALAVNSAEFSLDPQSAESAISDARPDDRTDSFPFNPAAPPASFTLTQPPYPGPRRVRLVSSAGDRINLSAAEVVWDPHDDKVFSLALRPIHDLALVNGVQALYSITAIFTTLKVNHTFSVQLTCADAAKLAQAEALSLGVLELNHQDLLDQSAFSGLDGDYSASVTVKSFKFVKAESPSATQRLFTYSAEVELKARRALEAGEGTPIQHIRTPGRPLDPSRPVDVQIDIDV